MTRSRLKLRLKRVSVATLALLSIAGLTATPASAAYCNLAECFYGGVIVDRSLPGDESKGYKDYVDADGIYSRLSTEFGLNVPFSNKTIGVTQPSGTTPIGHNTRGLQIGSEDAREFVQVGYTAGCGSADYDMRYTPTKRFCTGINASRGVQKAVFADGVRCDAQSCKYFVRPGQVIEGGTDHTYQLQRNYISSEGVYKFRFFFDGQQFAVENSGSLINGFASVDSERLGPRSGAFPDSTDYELNLNQDHFTSLYYHRFGDPSSQPPGTKNYRFASNSWRAYQRGFLPLTGQTCTVESYQVNQGVRVKGTC